MTLNVIIIMFHLTYTNICINISAIVLIFTYVYINIHTHIPTHPYTNHPHLSCTTIEKNYINNLE